MTNVFSQFLVIFPCDLFETFGLLFEAYGLILPHIAQPGNVGKENDSYVCSLEKIPRTLVFIKYANVTRHTKGPVGLKFSKIDFCSLFDGRIIPVSITLDYVV